MGLHAPDGLGRETGCQLRLVWLDPDSCDGGRGPGGLNGWLAGAMVTSDLSRLRTSMTQICGSHLLPSLGSTFHGRESCYRLRSHMFYALPTSSACMPSVVGAPQDKISRLPQSLELLAAASRQSERDLLQWAEICCS